MEKKFEFTNERITSYSGKQLFQIKALKSFADVKAGELGGFIEKEENLSQVGNAWVSDDAQVSGNALVSGSAQVSGNALVFGDDDYACIKGFGRKWRNTTFFRTKDGGVSVVCGCFYGTLQEFREKVKETHGESKMAKEYLMIADLMEMHFNKED